MKSCFLSVPISFRFKEDDKRSGLRSYPSYQSAEVHCPRLTSHLLSLLEDNRRRYTLYSKSARKHGLGLGVNLPQAKAGLELGRGLLKHGGHAPAVSAPRRPKKYYDRDLIAGYGLVKIRRG